VVPGALGVIGGDAVDLLRHVPVGIVAKIVESVAITIPSYFDPYFLLHPTFTLAFQDDIYLMIA